MIKLNFSYTDEFGEETNVSKTYTDAVFIDRTPFEFLVDEFKLFMLSMGYSKNLVDKIEIIDDDEE